MWNSIDDCDVNLWNFAGSDLRIWGSVVPPGLGRGSIFRSRAGAVGQSAPASRRLHEIEFEHALEIAIRHVAPPRAFN